MWPARIKRWAGVALYLTGPAVALIYVYLQNASLASPRTPQPSEGLTVPHKIKGVVVYLGQGQADTISIFQILFFMVFCLAVGWAVLKTLKNEQQFKR